MTDETRPGPGGDEAGPRKDGVLPVSPARRTRIVLRLRRPARRHPPDRQGPAERGRAEQGDGARAPRGRANPRGIAARRRRAERDRIPGGRRDLHAVRRLDPFPPDPRRILGRGRPAVPVFRTGRLERLGYRVLRTVRSPFDALSKHEETTFLTGVGEADRALERKAEVVSNLSRVVEKDSVMFVERARVRMSIRGVPVIAREELRRAKDRDDVEEMISERKG